MARRIMAAAGQRHSLGLRNDFAQRPDALRRKEQAAAANNMLRLPRIRRHLSTAPALYSGVFRGGTGHGWSWHDGLRPASGRPSTLAALRAGWRGALSRRSEKAGFTFFTCVTLPFQIPLKQSSQRWAPCWAFWALEANQHATRLYTTRHTQLQTHALSERQRHTRSKPRTRSTRAYSS